MLRSFALSLVASATLFAFSPAYAGDMDPLTLNGVIQGVKSDAPPSKVFGKEIYSFEPSWLVRQLMERGAPRAAISECNAKGVLSCDEAKVWLQYLDAQCNTVLLGIIDLGSHPGIDPKDVFNAEHPELILFSTRPDDSVPQNVNLYGHTDPNVFAAAMCPAESNAFGAAFRALKMIDTMGRQPR